MKTRAFLLASALFAGSPVAQALTIQYFGSARKQDSLSLCGMLSQAALLTDGKNPYQMGFARSDQPININNGADLHLCSGFGGQGGSGILLVLQQGIPEKEPPMGDLTFYDPMWLGYLSQLPGAYFAIKMETFEHTPDLFTILILTKGGQKLTYGPYEVRDAAGNLFDLDMDSASPVPCRFLFNPANRRVQFYLNDALLFSKSIDLINAVFGGDMAYVAVAATTGSQPDEQFVRLAQPSYNLCSSGGTCGKTEDFQNWIQDGPSERAQWSANHPLSSVSQLYNGGLTMFRSECQRWINTRSTFFAKATGTDNDMWGFVFGADDQDVDRSDDFKGYAFIWWKGQQTFTDPTDPARSYTSQPGMALVRLNGTIPDNYLPGGVASCFIGLDSCPAFNVLDTQPGIAWQENKTYTVLLDYTTERIRVEINGVEYFDISAPAAQPFQPGHFGFCTYSQAGVHFSNLNYRYFDAAQIPPLACANTPYTIQLLNSVTNSVTHIEQVRVLYGGGAVKDTLSGSGLSERALKHSFGSPQAYPYKVEVQVHTSAGCYVSQKDSIEVLPNPPLHLPPDPTPLCPGEVVAIDLTDHNSPAPPIIIWSTGHTAPYVVLSGPGLYWAKKTTGSGARQCTAADSILIQYFPASTIKTTVEPACEGQKSGTLSLAVQGGTLPFQFSWGQDTGSVPMFEGLSPGLYTVTVTDGAGCTSTEQVAISEVARPAVAFQIKNARCFGEKSGVLHIQNAPPDVLFSLDNFSFSSKKTWAGLAAGHYALYQQVPGGCVFTDTFSIGEPPQLTAKISAAPFIPLGDSLLLLGSVQGGFSPFSWLWQGPGAGTCNCPETTARPEQDAVYRLVVADGTGCTATAGHQVRVLREGLIYMPNVFLAEGYGPNSEVWPQAPAGSVREIKNWEIFNRDGGRVFLRENFQPNDPALGWDGFYRGRLAQAGVYAYLLEAELADGNIVRTSGDITILR